MSTQATLQTIKRGNSKSNESGVPAPKVLLAESFRWPATALLALDLANAGFEISFASPAHHPVLKTRAVTQMFPYSALRPLKSLKTAIEAVDPDMVIPCEERAVGHFHELHSHAVRLGPSGSKLAALIEKSLGSPQSYPIVSSRFNILRIAREEGLRVPTTAAIESESDLESWQARHGFPCVLKADGTYGGKGVHIVHSRSQAETSLGELTRFYTLGRAIKRLCVNRDAFWFSPWWNGVKPPVIAQPYIQGRPANCAVVCWRGKVLAGVGVDVLNAAGSTGPAGVVRLVDNPDMMLCAERIAARLNLSGFFGLDFMIEDNTGLTWLIEMNPRPTRLSRLQLGKEHDELGALYAQLSGQPARDIPPLTEKKLIAYFPDAWDSKSEFLESSYHDIPQSNPDLLQELRRPWPTDTLLWRLTQRVERAKTFLRKPELGFNRIAGPSVEKAGLNNAKLPG